MSLYFFNEFVVLDADVSWGNFGVIVVAMQGAYPVCLPLCLDGTPVLVFDRSSRVFRDAAGPTLSYPPVRYHALDA